MILELRLDALMDLQNQLNNKMAGEDWLDNESIKPYRAAWVECAELMDWLDYKWWKNQGVNKEEVLIELVDILHFILGEALKRDFFYDVCIEINSDNDPLKLIEDLVVSLIRGTNFVKSLGFFVDTIYSCGFTWEQVENLYYGKYALNQFRQEMGDRDGSYSRDWAGVEDNMVMYNAVIHEGIDPKDLFTWLEAYYSKSVTGKFATVAKSSS